MTTRIKLRRDDTTNWEALNPVLALGEPGFDLTENKIKIGDGVSAWMDLAYIESGLPIASNIALGGIKVGNNLSITEDGTLNAEDGNYTLPAATTNALGGVKLGEGFVLNDSNQVTTSKLYSTNGTDANVHYRLELDTNGVVVLPDQSIINGSTMRGVYGIGDANFTGITIGPDADHREESWVWVDASGAHIGTNYSGDLDPAHQWDFKTDGNLELPAGGYIVNSNGDDILAGLSSGGADLGLFNIEGNVLDVDSGTDIYIETYEDGGNGESRLVLKPQDDGEENPTRLEGSYNVGIWSNIAGGVDGNTNKWLFGANGTLTVPAAGITFPNGSYIKQQNEEGLILWQTDENAIDNNNDSEYVGLWYGGDPTGDAPNVSITAGSYNWSTDDDSLQYFYYPDSGADQGLRQINLDIRLDNDNILNWHFDTSGNLYLPADPSIVGVAGIVFPDGTVQTTASSNTGTSFEAPLPSWIDVISNTHHFPHVNTDYGFDSLGAWTVNATTGFDQEGTSYPFRTSFSVANNLKTVVTVDFDHQYGGGESDSDFGIGIFAAGTDPVWAWDGISGNLDANRIGAQYNGSNPQLHGISGGQAAEYGLPEYGTYRARLTVEPIDPGVAEITLETLDTSGTVLNTITYTETSFFDTDYKIGFASDLDEGAPRVYFKNLSINVDNGSAVYSDALTTYSSVLVATNSELSNNGFTVTLKTDGSLELPQLSTIADVEAGVELTINRESPNWYSVYGDLLTQSTANTTVTGSVTSDAGGNVYVLGSIVETGNFDGNNLLLKYNTEGELQWSRTWTDADGMNCGSYNATTRYLPPTAGTSDRETMYYASYVGGGITRPYSYVGTMDMEGELVDGFGNVRAAVEFANIRIADIEVGVGSNVYVVGARIDNLYTNTTVTPFIAKVDLDTYTANLALTVSSYYHDGTNTNPWTNFFKSATHDGTALYTIGTYYNDDFGYDWPILTKHIDGGYTRTYHLTNSNQYANIYGEEVAYSTVNDAVYVLMNSTDSDDYAVIGELASDLSEYTWIRRFGNNGIQVRLFSMEFDADGFIYIIGDLSGVDNGEFILIKMAANGDLVWQRKIGTTDDYEGSGENEFGPPGWSSSSSIIIDGTDIVFTGLTVGARFNAVTMKYPTDGSLTGDFGNFHAVEYDVGFVDDWGDSIYDRTADTSVTEINGDSDLVNDINSASLLATTKTLESGFSTYHWDMTNNHRYIAERKWTFGIDGSITLPSGAYLEEDEPGTLIIRSTSGTAINYAKHAQVADYLEGETTFAGVAANSGGVTVTVDTKIGSTDVERREWQFNNNGGLVFPDNTVQYGAYLNEEIMLDGGSAITVFPINVTTPRFVEGGGSGSRYGTTSPSYDGGDGGANINLIDFTLLLNGGGA